MVLLHFLSVARLLQSQVTSSGVFQPLKATPVPSAEWLINSQVALRKSSAASCYLHKLQSDFSTFWRKC